jgi:hypothetical protein
MNSRVIILFLLVSTLALSAFTYQASTIETSHVINPDELAKILQSSKGEKPLLIQVGFHVLYL